MLNHNENSWGEFKNLKVTSLRFILACIERFLSQQVWADMRLNSYITL